MGAAFVGAGAGAGAGDGAESGAVALAGPSVFSVACCGWLMVCVPSVLAVVLTAGLVLAGSGFVPWAAVTPIENRENMVSDRAR